MPLPIGAPLAAHKREDPSSTLGIEIDTVVGQLHLTSDKLERLVTTITQWRPAQNSNSNP